ncbi:MAG TPA: dienelactone hydrolase family protein [Bacteroides sp.]|nr:dienelactone hydrolase family protein [Bacteroides sp.]
MDPKIKELYSRYRAGGLDRRAFLRKLTLMTGGAAAAVSILSLLESHQLYAGIPTAGEPELHTEFITYPGATGDVRAYLARPKVDKKLPGVIVIHENRGLVPHIQDVNRRMAREGFLALAPDALSPLGGTPEDDEDKGRNMMRELDNEETVKNFVAAVKYLDTHPLTNGKVGCTGFCWGGGMTNQVAVRAPELDAAVPYYGSQPDPEDVPKIKAELMLHYAGEDERINSGIPAFEEALKKAGVEYQLFIYEGAQHAFNNDSNPGRYHQEAAELAWKRTIAFFREKLQV